MKTLSVINERDLTLFHRNYFIISLDTETTPLKNVIDKKSDESFFLISSLKKRFPKITDFGVIKVLVAALDIKNVDDCLIVYSNDNKDEALDLALAISSLMEVEVRQLIEVEKLKKSNSKKEKWQYLLSEMTETGEISLSKKSVNTNI